MLVLNISMPNKEKDWVLIETENGVIAVSAIYKRNQLRLVIDAPEGLRISRKSKVLEKENNDAIKAD